MKNLKRWGGRLRQLDFFFLLSVTPAWSEERKKRAVRAAARKALAAHRARGQA